MNLDWKYLHGTTIMVTNGLFNLPFSYKDTHIIHFKNIYKGMKET